MNRVRSRRTAAVLTASLVGVAIGGAVAGAAIPSKEGIVTACYSSTSAQSLLRVIDTEAGETCGPREHAVTLLGAAAKAADADKLDGQDSSAFLGASAKAADADKLDGQDSSTFLRTTDALDVFLRGRGFVRSFSFAGAAGENATTSGGDIWRILEPSLSLQYSCNTALGWRLHLRGQSSLTAFMDDGGTVRRQEAGFPGQHVDSAWTTEAKRVTVWGTVGTVGYWADVVVALDGNQCVGQVTHFLDR